MPLPRFSILTAGNIAETMAQTVSQMKQVKCRAVAARDLNRAQTMAETYGFETAFGSYEQLMADKETDIVYVASPHSHHYEHVKLCLNHGKHVLCEKALTVNAAQAEELFVLAEEKGLFLLEAMWTRFLPAVEKMQSLLAEGCIGRPTSALISFGQSLTHVERLMSPELAGGALLDLGVYPITMASLIFGDRIQDVYSTAVFTETGVDARDSITLTYEDGAMAILHSSILWKSGNRAVVFGTEGRMTLDNFWRAETIRIDRAGEKSKTYNCPFGITGLEYEVAAMVQALTEGRRECAQMPARESIRVMRLMDRLRRDWGLTFPCE